MRVVHLAVTMLLLCGAPCAGDVLPSASSHDHAWFVVTRGAVLELYHYARSTDGPYYDRGLPLTQVPRAMAAWGNQLWLIFETAGRRDVVSTQVYRNPDLGGWHHRPHDRFRAVGPLEALGELVDVTGSPGGPIVLLRPTARARSGVRAGAGSVASEPVLGRPTLLKLSGRQWVDVPLPEGFEPGPECRLVAGGQHGRTLILLNPSPERRAAAVYRLDRGDGGSWTRSDVSVPAGRIRALTAVGPAVALVTQTAETNSFDVVYLRPWHVLPLLTGFDAPGGAWAVLGLSDGLAVVESSTEGELSIRRIDPVSGRVGESRPMTPQPLMAARLLHRPLLLALAVTAIMAVLMFRPLPAKATISLGPTQIVAGPVPRVVGVCVDVAVAAGATLIVLRCPPADLARMPLWSTDLMQSVPFLLMLGLTILHSTVTELITGRTLGKILVGARVVMVDGDRPAARAILVRNLFKALVLLIPVLAVVALINPHGQGLGDLMARTVVVRPASTVSEHARNDR